MNSTGSITTTTTLISTSSTDSQQLDVLSSRTRGSLPFKKRRLFRDSPDLPSSCPKTRVIDSRDADEKIAALALLASAATPSQSSPKLCPRESSTPPKPQQDVNIVTPPVSLKPDLPASSSSSKSSSQQQQQQQHRQRVHHPPLASPLPGGCHGRTSRNNSYCRRQPCYNGSKYCKLHYQQYIVAGTRVPIGISPDAASRTPVSNAHQDKRFTGCQGEVRCQATTTRGRACAYVSVNGTKYCHLHSDYDTNPPPRRGGASSSSAGNSLNKTRQVPPTQLSVPNMKGCPSIPDLSRGSLPGSRPTLVTRDDVPSPKKPLVLSGGATFPSQAASSSVPHTLNGRSLLSSISSDQWFNKRVMIATGPLVNRIGHVEKWGNGWVTVRVRDGVLHNRRSVELFLLSDSDDTAEVDLSHQASMNICLPTSHRSILSQRVDGNARNNSVPTVPRPRVRPLTLVPTTAFSTTVSRSANDEITSVSSEDDSKCILKKSDSSSSSLGSDSENNIIKDHESDNNRICAEDLLSLRHPRHGRTTPTPIPLGTTFKALNIASLSPHSLTGKK